MSIDRTLTCRVNILTFGIKELSMSLACGLILLCNGCATSGYLANRGHDAADIFTLTAGKGFGGAIKFGPVHAGILSLSDNVGLKAGEFNNVWDDDYEWASWVDPLFGLPTGDGWLTGGECFHGLNDTSRFRRKYFNAKGCCPFVMLPYGDYEHNKYPAYFFSQIDVAVGLGLSVRAGFNPGELFDFLLGWAGVDIYNDDLREIPKDNK